MLYKDKEKIRITNTRNWKEMIKIKMEKEINKEILKFAKDILKEAVREVDEEDELDFEIVDELLEFGNEASVLPMYVSKSEFEPATEVIVCSSISGGSNDANKMPRELTITRKLLNGREYKARYMLI